MTAGKHVRNMSHTPKHRLRVIARKSPDSPDPLSQAECLRETALSTCFKPGCPRHEPVVYAETLRRHASVPSYRRVYGAGVR